ncbi:hypothetical protein LP419_21005 [Massilia sp. H-1]|nr:hypothetical protein LP419_21005 [Massilia sp. H-1]
MAEHLILCGRLDDAARMLGELDDSLALFYRSVILLLRDDLDAALAKLRECAQGAAPRNRQAQDGVPRFRRAPVRAGPAAQRRSQAPKGGRGLPRHRHARRAKPRHGRLSATEHAAPDPRRHGRPAAVLPTRNWEGAMQPFMFRALLHYWLAQPQLNERKAAIEQMLELSELAGFDLLSAQLASLLGRMGRVPFEQRAVALRQKHRFSEFAAWFEREEPWQRQLNALINLQPMVNVEVVKETRLVWGIKFDPRYGVQELEPREQKRDAQGGWSRGRAVGLKRLSEDAPSMEFLSAQDLNAIATIKGYKYYSGGGSRFEFDLEKAVAALIGHPLLFWLDSPATRVELLPGEPELLIKADPVNVTINMRPAILDDTEDVVVTRETPTRLRVVRIREEHRRIGAIVGEALVVPLHAEKQVLRAIGAISSIVTVQSDIGGSAADIAQVAADPRLHVHLLPYQHGLKMQILVRPLPDAGCLLRARLGPRKRDRRRGRRAGSKRGATSMPSARPSAS